MKLHSHASPVAALCLLLVTQPVNALYRFTVIAQFTPRSFQFVQTPPINDHGQIAFMMPSDQTGQGVAGLLLSQPDLVHPLTLVPDGFVDAGSRSINNLGQAAYVQEGVFVTDGIALTKIADSPDDPETEYHSVAINENGTVAFVADLDEDGNTAIFLWQPDAGLLTVSDGSADALNFHSPPALDGFDRVVFSAYDSDLHSTDVYLFDAGVITRLFERGVAPCVSGSGIVTFTRLEQTVGATTVLRGHLDAVAEGGESLTVIADSNGPFTRVLADSVNNRGQVVFRGSLPNGGLALCVGDGKTTIRVIQTGDKILNRTVSNVSPGSINNRGVVAAEVVFVDGSAAILRASKLNDSVAEAP